MRKVWRAQTNFPFTLRKQLMKRLAPSLLWITLHDIDVAHSGAYSLYLEGIKRSDRLVARALENDPKRTRIRRQNHDVYFAGLRPRFRRQFRRQRISSTWMKCS